MKLAPSAVPSALLLRAAASTALAASLALLAPSCCSTASPGKDGAPATGRKPFGGAPHAIPGVVEAEAFDEGPMGVAYHDVDPENQGAPWRPTSADIEERGDASGGHGVGWTRAGEWLAYTVRIEESGTYTVEVPAASNGPGGVFHLEVDGVDASGPIRAPDTGSWQKLETITVQGVRLEAGVRTLRVVMDSDGETGSVADIDLLRFTLTRAAPARQ